MKTANNTTHEEQGIRKYWDGTSLQILHDTSRKIDLVKYLRISKHFLLKDANNVACMTSNSGLFDMGPKCKCLVTFMALTVRQWYQDRETKAAKWNSAIVNYNEDLRWHVKMLTKMSLVCRFGQKHLLNE